MQLLGQLDSPYVRRVAIAMTWYGIRFEQRILSVFAEAEKIAEHNPLRRVPTLILDDGTMLCESFVCLDFIDEWYRSEHGPTDQRLLCPAEGSERLAVMRMCGLTCGVLDKAVSLAYEKHVREQPSPSWIARCHTQVKDALRYLEAERASVGTSLLFGDHLTHADIAMSCMMAFINEVHPEVIADEELPNLQAHAQHLEAWDEFSSNRQPFLVRKK